MDVKAMLKKSAAKNSGAMDGAGLEVAVKRAKAAYFKSEANGGISQFEFLYQQARYIQKRWWLLQGLVLGALWLLLYYADSGVVVRRCMGVMTPLFVVFILPELWKNRGSNSTEVESAAYFPLQKIYAARFTLFAAADLFLLSVFYAVSAFTVKLAATDFLIQFVLPLNVSCCICFRAFSRSAGFFASGALCFAWSAIWVLVVLNDGVYMRVTLPMWIALIALSFAYLLYSAFRAQKSEEIILFSN